MDGVVYRDPSGPYESDGELHMDPSGQMYVDVLPQEIF